MNGLARSLRRAILPASVFVAVAVAHYVYLGLFPDEDPAQESWAALPSAAAPSWWPRNVETQSYWLGLAYAMSLAFAALALRRYREHRFCEDRNLAIGGVTLSGFFAVAGCYLLGCCGSPMLIVYVNLFGATFAPPAKPLVAGVTVVSLTGAWLWMNRRSKRMPKRAAQCCSVEPDHTSRTKPTTP